MCCARLRAAPAALPPAQVPRWLRRAAVAGDDFPNIDAADSAVPTARGGLGFHTPRIVDAGVPWGSMPCPRGAFRGQAGSRGCWTERVARETRQSSSPRPRRAAPGNHRHAPGCARNSTAVRPWRARVPTTCAATRALRPPGAPGYASLRSAAPRLPPNACALSVAQPGWHSPAGTATVPPIRHPLDRARPRTRPRPDAGPDRPGQADGARP